MVFDNAFCQRFKQQEHLVINHLTTNQGKLENNDPLDPGVLSQYKELIREQDARISQISHSNLYLQQELQNAKQQLEEMTISVQTLQDQNSLLKSQNSMNCVTNGVASYEPEKASDKHLGKIFGFERKCVGITRIIY